MESRNTTECTDEKLVELTQNSCKKGEKTTTTSFYSTDMNAKRRTVYGFLLGEYLVQRSTVRTWLSVHVALHGALVAGMVSRHSWLVWGHHAGIHLVKSRLKEKTHFVRSNPLKTNLCELRKERETKKRNEKRNKWNALDKVGSKQFKAAPRIFIFSESPEVHIWAMRTDDARSCNVGMGWCKFQEVLQT